ncbi:hypothetical protein LAV73_08465 [Lysinibacillus xylanilyticus]|nr:hypothetical protein [Lysinibacillus xylanilyticus]
MVFGTTSTTFSPYQNLTRGEAAYFLAEALKLETKNVVNPGFSDVPRPLINITGILPRLLKRVLFKKVQIIIQIIL